MTALHNQFKWKQRENIKEYEYTKVFTKSIFMNNDSTTESNRSKT